MEALVSGQAGAAAILGRTAEVRAVGATPTAGVPPHLLGRIFSGASDVRKCTVTSTDQLDALARQAWAADRGLRMFLMLLDPAEPEEDLPEYAACLEELLAEPGTERFIRQNLCSAPLPDSLRRKPVTAALQERTEAGKLFADLLQDQPQIAQVRNAFDAIPPDVFSQSAPKAAVLEAAIAHGAFVDLVDAKKRGADINLVALKLSAQMREVEGVREIIGAWTRTMRAPRPEMTSETSDRETKEPANMFGGALNVRGKLVRIFSPREETLVAFEDTTRRFPQDAVTPTAGAEIQEDALAALDTMRRFYLGHIHSQRQANRAMPRP